MSWTFTDLKYGWKIAAGITLAAVTIFVADNTRERVNQADVIELALGTAERCLATQYSTNPVTYYVTPPSFVRSWYSNNYVTTNVPGDTVTNWTAVLYTNTFTNVIGWRTDRAMMVSLDATIKALVPYYCDTNTVYDGTTNISMLTFTGLLASLNIGDGTNFTSTPEWVGTNGVTNAATYGDLPWRIYKEDLEERYKVLNALKVTASFGTPKIRGQQRLTFANQSFAGASGDKSWEESVSSNTANWTSFSIDTDFSRNLSSLQNSTVKSIGWARIDPDNTNDYHFEIESMKVHVTNSYSTRVFPNQIEHMLEFWYRMPTTKQIFGDDWYYGSYNDAPVPITVYELNGFPVGGDTPGWHLLTIDPIGWSTNVSHINGWSVDWGLPINSTPPPLCNEVIPWESPNVGFWNDVPPSNFWGEARGGPILDNEAEIYRWQFSYCTNKYW